MSLILEALRKSEAERRRGQAPDLLSEAVPLAAAPRTAMPRHWPWLLAGMAAVAGAASLAVWWRGGTALPDAPVATRATGADIAPSRGAVAAAPRPAVAPDANGATVEGRTAAPARAGAGIAGSPSVTSTRASVPQPAFRAPEPDPASTVPARAPPQRVEPHVPAVARAESASNPPPAPPRKPVVDAASPAPAAATFTSPTLPLRLSELSGEERQQLPALKVSMHMWTPDAGNRFAIIDGARVNEGDRVGEATVEAIQQDGVMLSWRGRQIRLPLR